MILNFLRLLHTAALLLLLLAAIPATSAGGEPPDVLILHSYHMGQVWTDGVMAGMAKSFEDSGDNARLHVEYMDTKRYQDPSYLIEILDILLTYKLQRFHFDLVLISDNDALNFVLQRRNDLFANTPIVFCGVNNYRPEMIAGVEDITGVAEYPNFRETIRLALNFHPASRKMVVIGNTRNETDRQNYRLFLDVIPEFSDWLDFEHWDNLSLGEVVRRLRHLDSRTIVFINGLLTDRQGNPLPFSESNRQIREATSAPLYSGWDFFLGEGIVGGRLVSSRRHGELGAELALRILHGEDPDDIPVIVRGTNQYMFDDRELRRFGISRRSLPAGSLVINVPEPFLSLTQRETSYGIGMGVLLLLLLTALALTLLRQRRTERALRDSEERFRAIADHSYDWDDWIGPDGRLCWVSPSVEMHTGYSVAECMAMPDYPLPILREEDREEMARMLASTLANHSTGNNYPVRIRRKDGKERWMAVSWHPIYNDRGKYLGTRASIRDITDRQEAEEELRSANQELDAFVRSVSHDLRTPLTPIIGYAELLRRQYGGTLDDTARWAMEQIELTGRRMHTMLEDLLSLARVGSMEIPEEPVDGSEVVGEVLSNLAPRIEETGATVVTAKLPKVRVPRSLLAQALENLIGNAVRYAGRKGPIEVGGTCRGDRLWLYVRDHGPGIHDGEKELIFNPFYRGTAAARTEGTGIGLATVRRIARRLGGRVWVEDTPGGGSTFWIEVETGECLRKGN